MDPGPLLRMLQAAKAEGVTALAAFLGLCEVCAERARLAMLEALDPSPPKPPSGPLLVTAKEASGYLGPSFTPAKLYRLRHTMPSECYVWKGGRLYFHLPALREWAGKQ